MGIRMGRNTYHGDHFQVLDARIVGAGKVGGHLVVKDASATLVVHVAVHARLRAGLVGAVDNPALAQDILEPHRASALAHARSPAHQVKKRYLLERLKGVNPGLEHQPHLVALHLDPRAQHVRQKATPVAPRR